MNLAIGASTVGTWKRYTGQHLRVALAGAVALAAVAAVGTWQSMDNGGGTAAPAFRGSSIGLTKSVDQPFTYYVVASQDDATKVLFGEDEAARIRQAEGDSFGPAFEVIIAPAGNGYMPMITDLNAVRLAGGLGEVLVVDLRGF